MAGQIDPTGDIDVIETELLLADLETVTKAHERAERQAKNNEKEAVAWRDLLARVLTGLERGTPCATSVCRARTAPSSNSCT